MVENDKFREGIALFNAGKYFESHEVWEELWLAAAGDEKTFLQGLIQVAAAFHHHARGNWSGMRSLMAAGLMKLDPLPDCYRGIALGELRDGVRCWLEGSAEELEVHCPRIRLT